MSNNPISIAPITALVRRRIFAGLFSLKKRHTPQTASESNDLWLSTPMSGFDEGVPATFAEEEHQDVSPLTEAEIYVIFGRRNEAEEVLKSAMRGGRVMPEEVSCFWERMDTERGRVAGF